MATSPAVKEPAPHPQPCPCCPHCQEWMDSLPKMMSELLSQIAQGLLCSIEERFQKAVDNLVQNSCLSCCRSLPHDAKSSVSRSLRLHFLGSLPDELITSDHIKSEGALLMVELQDSSGSRVETDTESSVKIKIFVLDGDFEVEDRDDWTATEFDKNIAQPRKGKGPLLKGKCEIVMKNGVAVVEDLAFTDNSKSMRNGMFRLGARVVKGLPEGVEIRDAVSKAFKVKERRMNSYRKSKTLSLEDGSECLLNIGRTLARKLADKNIFTVQDFLQLYHTDTQALKALLCLTDNKWSELVKNAKSCRLSKVVYQHTDTTSGVTLALDCVFNIKEVVFEGTATKLYAALDDSEKELVNQIRCSAYEKRRELQEFHPSLLTQRLVEFGSSSNLHPSAQYLDAMGAEGDKNPIATIVNSAINKEWGGQDTCSILPNQIHQGKEGGFPRPDSPGHDEAVSHMMFACYQGDRTDMLASYEQQLPVDKDVLAHKISSDPRSSLYFEYQRLPESQNQDFCIGLDPCFGDPCTVNGTNNTQNQPWCATVPPQDTYLQSMAEGLESDSSYSLLQNFNQPFDSSPLHRSLKRQRCDD